MKNNMGKGVLIIQRISIFILLLVPACIVFSNTKKPLRFSIRNPSEFIENKGQIIDQNNKPNNAVKYLLNTPGFNIQLRRGGFSYDVYSVSDTSSHILHPASDKLKLPVSVRPVFAFHRIDFDLIGANPNCEVLESEPSTEYYNYYTTGTPLEGITNVRSYKSIIYKNIYTGIDLEFLSNEQKGFKYNFVIHPTAKLDDIRIKISGPEIELNSSGSLLLKISMGDIEEDIPESYIIADNIKTKFHVRFLRVGKNEFGFCTTSTPENYTMLMIDPVPNRLWGTYYGGSGDESGYDCKTDHLGYIYLTGDTYSLQNIATTGAFQLTIAGSYDAFLSKFDQNGQIQWGTYFGGSNYDRGECLSIDKTGMIYLSGLTGSDAGISTPGAFQETYAGGPWGDLMLVKFSPGGQRIWCTYYGGNNNENASSCAVDNMGFIYLSGLTYSLNNISTPGSFKPVFGGMWDAFLVKLDTSGQNRIWGTYYGGNNTDFALSCSTDTLGHVLISGGTQSTTGIASAGAYQPTLYPNGYGDAFLALFNSSGQRLWGTYYGGELEERFNDCSLQKNGNIYATGETQSVTNISSPGAYQISKGGDEDAFLVKFNLDGQRYWGTYFGGTSLDVATGCAVDDSGFIYISGSTKSMSSISTPGSFQPVFGGIEDAFLAKFDSNSSLKWSTYYGGSSEDFGTKCDVDTSGRVYLCGYTNSTNNIATASAFQITNGGLQDAFLVKLGNCSMPDPAGLITGPNNICLVTTGVTYTIPPILQANTYIWHLPGGSVIVSGSGTNSITVDFTALAVSGIISVHGVNDCGSGDSAYIAVVVTPGSEVSVGISASSNVVCSGSLVTFTATPVNPGTNPVYIWKVNDVATGPNTPMFTYTPSNNDLVTCVLISDVSCPVGNPATSNAIAIAVNPYMPVSVSISPNVNPVCAGIPVTIDANPVNPGSSPVYTWTVNGVNAGTNSSSLTYNPINGDVVSCVLTSSLTTCVTSNPATSNPVSMTVNPLQPVNVSIGASATSVCSGTSVALTAAPVNPGSSPVYQWKVNGVIAGTNSTVFTYVPVNGDVVVCTLTSSLTICVTNNPASCIPYPVSVNPLLPVSVTVAASANPICSGSSVTFNATPLNQGSAPVYQWKVNGVNYGSNSPVYSYIPSNNDQVWCTLTSSEPCAINNPASCIPYPVSVKPLPQVSYSSCYDTITTINAKPIKLKGGVPVGGTYSGPGVNSTTGYFNPSAAGVGVKTISYFYQNIYSCSDSKTRTITVQPSPSFTCGGLLTDIRDGKTYPTVLLGTQCWMQKNLDYGSTISAVNHQKDNCMAEKYCYNDIASNCSLYGGLYQWDEVMQFMDVPAQQGLCPAGWHIPTQAEWMVLFNHYQGQGLAGKPMQDSIISGFKALENGVNYSNASWNFKGFASIFWTSTPSGSIKAVSHGMNLINFSVSDYYSNRSNAFGVRCVKD